MISSKRAELSMSVIIGIIIGVLVLIMISFALAKKFGLLNESTNECISKGGMCFDNSNGNAVYTERASEYDESCKKNNKPRYCLRLSGLS